MQKSLWENKEARVQTDALTEKISGAIEKVRALKQERDSLRQRVSELESLLLQKDREIEHLQTERASLRAQLEELLQELEGIQL